jgi:glycosyltransferase involved in cell wall biosynthesis
MGKDVYIDLTGTVGRKRTGIERYAENLYEVLKKKYIGINIVYLTLNKSNLSNSYVLGKNFGRIITEYIYLPFFIFRKKPKVVIFPVFPPSILCWFMKSKNTNIIPVIFDIVPWKYKYKMSFWGKVLLIPRLNACLKYAKEIITISKTERKSLRKYTNANIIVIYPSISDSVLNKNTNIIKKLKIKNKKYLLTVSTIEPRKNFLYLIRTLLLVQLEKYGLKIVIVGRSGWGKDVDVLKSINCNNSSVVMTGYVSDDDLSVLYQRALLYLTLPIHEGFGFTPVESLLNNTPVIVSDIPIFHEILSVGANFVTLSDADLAAKEIEKIIFESCAGNDKIDYKEYYSRFRKENSDNLIIDDFLNKYF